MSEYRGKEFVLKNRPDAYLEDVSLNGTCYEVLIPAVGDEEEVLGSGPTAMDAWHDAAIELEATNGAGKR